MRIDIKVSWWYLLEEHSTPALQPNLHSTELMKNFADHLVFWTLWIMVPQQPPANLHMHNEGLAELCKFLVMPSDFQGTNSLMLSTNFRELQMMAALQRMEPKHACHSKFSESTSQNITCRASMSMKEVQSQHHEWKDMQHFRKTIRCIFS